MQPAVPDVGAGVPVASAPHADLQAVPPGKINGNRRVLRGGRHHDDAGLEGVTVRPPQDQEPRTHSADAGSVVDRPECLVPRAAAGDHLAYHQVVEERHRGRVVVAQLLPLTDRQARTQQYPPQHAASQLVTSLVQL